MSECLISKCNMGGGKEFLTSYVYIYMPQFLIYKMGLMILVMRIKLNRLLPGTRIVFIVLYFNFFLNY